MTCIYVLDMCIWWCMYVYVVNVWLCMFLVVHVMYVCVYHTYMYGTCIYWTCVFGCVCMCILWMYGACCACIYVYVVHICNCKCKIVKLTQHILQTVTNIGLQFLATWSYEKHALFVKSTCTFCEKHLCFCKKCAFHMKSTWKGTKQLNSTHISHFNLVFHRVQREC